MLYLFNKGNIRFEGNVDLFEVTQFALSDQDTNYLTGARLSSGDIPDATGESDGSLQTAVNMVQQNLIFYDVDGITPGGSSALSQTPKYIITVLNGTTLPDGSTRDTIDINNLPKF